MSIEQIDVVSNDSSIGNYLKVSNSIYDIKGNNIGNSIFELICLQIK